MLISENNFPNEKIMYDESKIHKLQSDQLLSDIDQWYPA